MACARCRPPAAVMSMPCRRRYCCVATACSHCCCFLHHAPRAPSCTGSVHTRAPARLAAAAGCCSRPRAHTCCRRVCYLGHACPHPATCSYCLLAATASAADASRGSLRPSALAPAPLAASPPVPALIHRVVAPGHAPPCWP
nr:keratin-associated protein 4-5-like [Aegilops tauschii subsp. strangulata]